MEVDAVIAALNDTYKMNSTRVVSLFEEAERNTSLENSDLEALIDFVRAKTLEDESFEPIFDKLVSVLREADLNEYQGYIEKLEEEDVEFITILDPMYPQRLKQINKPPLGLYVRGDLEVYQGGVALVGTRSATDHRLEFAHDIGKALVKSERTIISGLATGIDEAGHRSALSYGGKTLGVLPAHINKIYPKDNSQMAKNIPRNGALVSEVSDNVPLNRHRFVERNRITSGLSEAIIVAASKDSGGTVRQAEFADSQDIPILLYDPEQDDGQSPPKIKEMGAHTFASIEELGNLLSNLPDLRVPNGGNLKISEY